MPRFPLTLPTLFTLSKFLSWDPRQMEITHSYRQLFFENTFSPAAKKGGKKYDLLYQMSIRKYEDD